MIVQVGKRAYEMPFSGFKKLAEIASARVPFGIYAIVKKDGSYAEMLRLHCKSKTELKQLKRDFKSQGFKVLANEKRV